MTLDEALKAQLVGYSGLNTFVNGRVLALTTSEQTMLPAVTFQRISSPPIQHRGRAGQGPESGSKTRKVRFQVEGVATSNGGAVQLSTLIEAALVGWTRASGPRVDRTFLRDRRDLRDPATGRYRASLDFELWAEES